MKLDDVKLPWCRLWAGNRGRWHYQVSVDPGDWVLGVTVGPVVQQGYRYFYVALSLGPMTCAVMW